MFEEYFGLVPTNTGIWPCESYSNELSKTYDPPHTESAGVRRVAPPGNQTHAGAAPTAEKRTTSTSLIQTGPRSRQTALLEFMATAAGIQYRETCYLYWFDNNYRSLLADYPESEDETAFRAERKQAAQSEKTKTAAALKQRINAVIEQKAQIILLDWVLPNGKALRDCTGTECKQMSRKVGGWHKGCGTREVNGAHRLRLAGIRCAQTLSKMRAGQGREIPAIHRAPDEQDG
jgi:hypothetical protein